MTNTIDRETDTRLIQYINALQTGNIDRVIEVRLKYADNAGLKKRFATVEEINSNLLALYTHEIQILRLELSGWKSISEGQDTLAMENITTKERRAAHQKVYRGLEQIKRAAKYRESHSEIDLPKLPKIP